MCFLNNAAQRALKRSSEKRSCYHLFNDCQPSYSWYIWLLFRQFMWVPHIFSHVIMYLLLWYLHFYFDNLVYLHNCGQLVKKSVNFFYDHSLQTERDKLYQIILKPMIIGWYNLSWKSITNLLQYCDRWHQFQNTAVLKGEGGSS
jgi:hypothetical protein